jgi:Na+-driven multidrug efflux pump
VGITLVGSVVVYLFAQYIVHFFTTDGEIANIAVGYLRIITFSYPLVALSMTSGRVLQGLGKGTPMLIITGVRILLVSAPLASIMTFVLELSIVWVWYSLVWSVMVSATIAMLWMRAVFRRLDQALLQAGYLSSVD